MSLGGFSWKRFLGISAAKSRLSRTIGIPLTRGGRERKLGRMLMGGGGRRSGGCGGCGLVILIALCAGWKGCSSIFNAATNPPANSTATAQVPAPSPDQAEAPTNAGSTNESRSPSPRDRIENGGIPPDPLLLKSLVGVRLPASVTSIAQVNLLNAAGMEVAIPVDSIIKVMKRSEHGTLTMEINGAVFVGHEYRLSEKVRLR